MTGLAEKMGWLTLLVAIFVSALPLVAAGVACTTSGVASPPAATVSAASLTDGDPTSQSATYGSGQCAWLLSVTDSGQVVQLTVDDWNLGVNGDHLTVYDGATTSAPVLGIYYGSRYERDGVARPNEPKRYAAQSALWDNVALGAPMRLYASGGTMLIVLSTDQWEHVGGFALEYQQAAPRDAWGASQTLAPIDLLDVGNGAYDMFIPKENDGSPLPRKNATWTLNAGTAPYFAVVITQYRQSLVPGDVLCIYDGNNATAPRLGCVGAYMNSQQNSGTLSRWFVPSGHSLHIVLSVNTATEDWAMFTAGVRFRLETSSVPPLCRGRQQVVLTASTTTTVHEPASSDVGVSPKYPSPNPINACEWEITAPVGYVVQAFAYDFVRGATFELYDGAAADARRIIDLSAQPSNRNYAYTSTGRVMVVKYATNGFPLPSVTSAPVWTADFDAVPDPRFCSGTVVATLSTATAATPLIILPAINNSVGQLPMPTNLVCEWVLSQQDGAGFSIWFQSALAPDDTVTLESVDTTSGARTLLASSADPAALGFADYLTSITTGKVVITLRTGAVPAITYYAGLKATVSAIPANANPNCAVGVTVVSVDTLKEVVMPLLPSFATASHTLGDLNDIISYSPSSTCQWRFTAASQPFVSVQLTADIRAGTDTISFYDGSSASAPLIATFSGATSDSVYASGASLFAVFTSGAGAVSQHGINMVATASATNDDPSLPLAQANSYCGNQGSYSLSAGDAPVILSTTPFPRHVTCTWRFHRDDFVGTLPTTLGFRIGGLGTASFNSDVTFTIYDGTTTSSPIVFQYTNGAPDYARNPFAATSVLSQSADMLVVLTSGYHLDATLDGNLNIVIDAETSSWTSGNPLCSGLTTIALGSGNIDTLNPIKPVESEYISVVPNMHCQWLIQANGPVWMYLYDPNIPYPFSGDFYPSEAQVKVYDGMNSSAPLIPFNRESRNSRTSSTGNIFVEFSTSASQVHATFGFRMTVYRNHPTYGVLSADGDAMCNGHYEVNYMSYTTISELHLRSSPPVSTTSSPSIQADEDYFVARRCTWRVTAWPGLKFSLMSHPAFRNSLTGNDTVAIYDGYDDSAPLLHVMSARGDDVVVPWNTGVQSTDNVVFVVFTTDGRSNQGFDLPVQAMYVNPEYYDQEHEIRRYLTATGGEVGDPYFQDYYDSAFSYYVTPQPWSAPNDPIRPFVPRDGDVYVFRSRMICGVTPPILIQAQFADAEIEVRSDDGLLFYASTNEMGNLYFNPHITSMPENVTTTLRVHKAGRSASFYHVILGRYRQSVCRKPGDIPCFFAADINPIQGDSTYQDCTIIRTLFFDAVNGANFSFPHVRVLHYLILNTGPLTNVSLPLAYHVTNIFFMATMAEFSLPSATMTNYITGNGNSGMSVIALNQLRAIGYTVGWASGYPVDLQLESLEFGRLCFWYSGIQRLHLPNMRELNLDINFSGVSEIYAPKAIRVPHVVAVGTYVQSFELPSVRGMIGFVNLASAAGTTVDLGGTWGAQQGIDINYPRLDTFIAPNLTYIGSSFTLNTFRATSLDVSKLRSVGLINFATNTLITSVIFPALESVTAIGGIQIGSLAAVTQISFPRLTGAVQRLQIMNADKLVQLDMCGVTSIPGGASFSSCASLSCFELKQLMGNIGVDVTSLNSPDCSPITRGTFGCKVLTLTVNTTSCGFTLPCIQQSIDYSYANLNGSVYVPPGTYTGCSTPLNMHGKIITIFGASAGGSVIDCGGSGRAFTFSDADTFDGVEIRDLTIRNGATANGALTLISATSPTFRRLRFERGITTAAQGGAVYMSLNSAPRFIDCVFTASTATTGSGGAMVVAAGASATLTGCVFSANSAAKQGAGVLVSGATSFEVHGGAFIANTAQQGAGLFTDSDLIISGANFSANSAAVFGGGMAVVPADVAEYHVIRLVDTSFENNRAGSGGGLYLFSGNLATDGCAFLGNQATRDGGGMTIMCSCALKVLYDILGVCDMRVNMSDTVLVGNSAGGDGGGIHATDNFVTLIRPEARGNRAEGSGGAIYAEAALVSMNGTYVGNYAGQAGGAIFVSTLLTGSVVALRRDNDVNGNDVASSGYGGDLATEAAMLSFSLTPSASYVVASSYGSASQGHIQSRANSPSGAANTSSILIGAYVSSSANSTELSVQLRDGLDQVALGVLTPILLDVTCDDGVDVAIVGNTAVLLQHGVGTFSVYFAVRSAIQNASTACNLTCSDSTDSTRVVTVPFELGMQCPAHYGIIDEGNGKVCRACVSGSTVATDLGAACIPCAAGSYSNGDICLSCPADSYTPTSGLTACSECPGAATGASTCSAPQCNEHCGGCNSHVYCVSCQPAFTNVAGGCNECSDVTLTQFAFPDCRIRRENQLSSAGIIAAFLVILAIPTVAWSIKRPLQIQHDVVITAHQNMPFQSYNLIWPMSSRLMTITLIECDTVLTAVLEPTARPFITERPPDGQKVPTTFHIELDKDEMRLLDQRKMSVTFTGPKSATYEIVLNFPVRRTLANFQVGLSTLLEFVQLAAVGFSPYVPWSKADVVISGWRNALVLLPSTEVWPAIYWLTVGCAVFFLLCIFIIVSGLDAKIIGKSRVLKWIEAFISSQYLPLIGSTLFLTVIGVLVSGLSCSRFINDPYGPYVMSSHRGVECWSAQHAPYAVMSILVLLIFVPVAVHYLPLWQVLTPTKDIRLHGEYLLLTSQAKYFMVAVASLFEGTNYVQIVAVVLFVTPMPVYLIFRPNAVVPFMRPLQVGLYLGVVWTAVASIVATQVPGVITSSIVLYVGWGVMLLVTAFFVRRVAANTRMADNEKELDADDKLHLVRRGLAGQIEFHQIEDASADFSHEVSDYSASNGRSGSEAHAASSGLSKGSGSASQLKSRGSSSSPASLSKGSGTRSGAGSEDDVPFSHPVTEMSDGSASLA